MHSILSYFDDAVRYYIYILLCRLNSRNSGDGSIYPVPGWTDPPLASLGAEPDGSPSRL